MAKIIEKIIKLPEIANEIKSLKEEIKLNKNILIQEEITDSVKAHGIELPDKSMWLAAIKGSTGEHLHSKSMEHTFVLEGKGRWIMIDKNTPHRFT